VSLVGELASIMMMTSCPAASYGAAKAVKSSSICCHGFGCSMPISRSRHHCCIADVSCPHPISVSCVTWYAMMMRRFRVPSSNNSCHAYHPRSSFPRLITRPVIFLNTICVTPPGW
jgi:hypothetical protein